MQSIERLTLTLLLLALLTGCTVGRRYIGSEIQADPREWIVIGDTTRREVLTVFGPPDRILRQSSGDVFIYRCEQRNESEFVLKEQFVTRLQLFTWNKVQEKSDRLTVFFDRLGVVSAFGYRRGRDELEPL